MAELVPEGVIPLHEHVWAWADNGAGYSEDFAVNGIECTFNWEIPPGPRGKRPRTRHCQEFRDMDQVLVAATSSTPPPSELIEGYVYCDRRGGIHVDTLDPYGDGECLPEHHSPVMRASGPPSVPIAAVEALLSDLRKRGYWRREHMGDDCVGVDVIARLEALVTKAKGDANA